MELAKKSLALFNAIKENNEEDFTAADYAAALAESPAFDGAEVNARTINGTATALQNKKLIQRVEGTVEDAEGKTKIVKYLHLTDLGKEAEVTLKVEAPKKEKTEKEAA